MEWINKKNYSTVVLVLGRGDKVLLRAADGLEDWFELLEVSKRCQCCKIQLLNCSNTVRLNNSCVLSCAFYFDSILVYTQYVLFLCRNACCQVKSAVGHSAAPMIPAGLMETLIT